MHNLIYKFNLRTDTLNFSNLPSLKLGTLIKLWESQLNIRVKMWQSLVMQIFAPEPHTLLVLIYVN